jgi:hypothetical protein
MKTNLDNARVSDRQAAAAVHILAAANHRQWTLATCSGVPSAMTRPPPAPPSGPISMIQSAFLMTSRLCSMTTMLLPALHQGMQHVQQLVDVCHVQAGGRFVQDVERAAGRGERLSSVDSLIRWASPPEASWPTGRGRCSPGRHRPASAACGRWPGYSRRTQAPARRSSQDVAMVLPL